MTGPIFSFPLRPWSRFRCDAGFLDAQYLEDHGKNHRGADFNLKTGGDTDLGYPVSAIFPGVVRAAAVYGSWGGIVVVRADEWVRKMFSDRLERPIGVLEVQYAHLHHIPVQVDDCVNAGECVGTVGKGTHAQYVAHLHLELRVTELHPAMPQGSGDEDRKSTTSKCLNPQVVFERLPFSDNPTTLAQKAYYVPTRILDVDHAGQPGVLIHPVGDKLYLEGVP